ncbi:MAG: hypothetical protein R2932_44355 [Caldilineaceae bacterium]
MRFFFGGLAHDGGVEHDNIGIVEFVGGAVADLFEFGGLHGYAVGDIHLAANGPDVVLAARQSDRARFYRSRLRR